MPLDLRQFAPLAPVAAIFAPAPPPPTEVSPELSEALKGYARRVWDSATTEAEAAEEGGRNLALFKCAATLAQFVAPPWSAWTFSALALRVHSIGAALGLPEEEVEGILRKDPVRRPQTRAIPPKLDPALAPLRERYRAAAAPAEELPLRRWTDAGNALALVDRYEADIRYVRKAGLWLRWRGQRWEEDEHAGIRAAIGTAQSFYDEAHHLEGDPTQTKHAAALKKHAKACEHASRIAAMVRLAEADERILVKPDDLDADPLLLACGNGVLDLRTGELVDAHRDQLITKGTAIRYQPSADCPTWERFLLEVFEGNEELVGFIRRAIGYSLTGRTDEQIFFLLHGGGSNGKSTLVRVLGDLLGDYSATTPFDTFLESRSSIPNDVAALRGARMVAASEPPEGARFSEGMVKNLTGGDEISARFMRAEWFTFAPCFKVWLSCNVLPDTNATDDGFWRRVRLVPFNVSFLGREDRSLPGRLRLELSGVLTWAVRGCMEWQRDGLAPPDEVMRATARYRSESDNVGEYIREGLEHVEGSQTPKDIVFRDWQRWCERRGLDPGNIKRFGRLVGTRLATGRTASTRTWLGVRVRSAY